MNEFEKLEEELKGIHPLPPSKEFTGRLEKALGDAGKVAICCLPGEDSSKQVQPGRLLPGQTGKLVSFHKLAAFAGIAGLGLAAVWAILFYLSSSLLPERPAKSNVPENSLLVQNTDIKLSEPMTDDPDSPLHGLTLDQIQNTSVMPVSGWLDPQINERLLRMVDEGIFQQPGGLPARRVRHYFRDETLWSHPASDTRILSTTPREEVILIELETY